MRTLGGILTTGGTIDVTRLGWPTLRAGFPLMPFLNAMREMRTALKRRAAKDTAPVMAVIGAGAGQDRSIAALNIALSAARDGARVLMIDADHRAHALSNNVSGAAKDEPSRLGWLNIGTKAFARRSRPRTEFRSCRPSRLAPRRVGRPSTSRLRRRAPPAATISSSSTDPRCRGARPTTGCSTPSTGWSRSCRSSSISTTRMEDIITALGETERKLVGVVINELNPTAVNRQRDKQYA